MTTFFQSLRSRRTNLAQLCPEELALLRGRHLAEAARIETVLAERDSPPISDVAWHRRVQQHADGSVRVYCHAEGAAITE